VGSPWVATISVLNCLVLSGARIRTHRYAKLDAVAPLGQQIARWRHQNTFGWWSPQGISLFLRFGNEQILFKLLYSGRLWRFVLKRAIMWCRYIMGSDADLGAEIKWSYALRSRRIDCGNTHSVTGKHDCQGLLFID
jgi:hypothetical protein